MKGLYPRRRPKSTTYGLSRFFSSLFGKIPGLSFLADECRPKAFLPDGYGANRRGAIVKSRCLCFRHQANTETATPKHKRGRPKGSRNRNKNVVVLSDVLKQLQTMVKGLLQQIGNLNPSVILCDGYFGHNNALQMAKQCKLHPFQNCCPASSTDDTLCRKGTPPHIRRAFRQNLKTEVYQMEARHKKFADELNVVCILKTLLFTLI